MTKICMRCNESKALDEFPPSGGNDRRSSYCRPCKKAYDREYYEKNRAHMKDGRSVTRPNARRKAQEVVWKYLAEHPCQVCGEDDIVVLEFDHRDPKEKVKSISNMICWRFGVEKILAEIAKCDVLCANCHRRKTAKQFGWNKLIAI